MVHRLEDASRAGSLARYRNRQSVYQFSELGYRAFAAVEDVLSARIRDANLSRLVFSDILDDLRALARGHQGAGRGAGVPAAVAPGHGPGRHVPPRGTVPPDARRDHPVDRHLAGHVPAVQERPAHPHDRLHGRTRPLSAAARRRRSSRGGRPRPGDGTRTPCCGSPPRPTSARSSAATNCWTTGAAAGPRCAPGSLPTTPRPASPGPRACAPPPAPPSPASSRCSARSPRRSAAG